MNKTVGLISILVNIGYTLLLAASEDAINVITVTLSGYKMRCFTNNRVCAKIVQNNYLSILYLLV